MALCARLSMIIILARGKLMSWHRTMARQVFNTKKARQAKPGWSTFFADAVSLACKSRAITLKGNWVSALGRSTQADTLGAEL